MTVAESYPGAEGGAVSAETGGPEAGDAHGAAPAPSKPFWQTRPCPPWCGAAVVLPHKDGDMREDRACLGADSCITLTLDDAAIIPVRAIGGYPAAVEVSLPYLTAGLEQGYREAEPHVVLTHNATRDIPLTLAEAGRLAETLADLVRQAREGAR